MKNINIDKKILYILSSILFLVLSFSFGLPIDNTKILSAVILLIFAIVICYFIKKRTIYSYYKNQVLMLMFVIGLLFLMFLYLSGTHFGFYKVSLTLSLISFVKVIIPITIIIVTFEIIRSVLLAQENKLINVLVFLTGVVVELLIFSNIHNITTFNYFMDMIGLTLFPAVTFNFLYNYLSKKYGMYPNIVFRLLVTLYPYIIPVVPATPDSFVAFFKLVLPLIIYFFISSLYENKKKVSVQKDNKFSYVISCFMLIVMISIVMIISGQFRIGAIVIGSDSMSGEINKGDVVIYEKYEGQIIGEDSIILFKKGESVIIHRVVKIENVNNQIRYFTKGDANDDLDNGYITQNDILGIVNFKIAYIGYPTIWLRNIFLEV